MLGRGSRFRGTKEDTYSTFEDMNKFGSTTHAGPESESYNWQRRKPNHKRQVERQSEFINSAEAGFKLFGGFIGSHHQRSRHGYPQ